MLLLGIPLNLRLDVDHKQDRFSKSLIKKDLEFVLSKEDSLVALNLDLVLLLAKVDSILKVDFIPEKQGCKKNILMAHGIGHIKIILVLSTKVIIFHIQAFIIQVGIPSF